MIFEVPDVDEKDLKFSDKTMDSPLLKYFYEYRKIREELKKTLKDDSEIKFLIEYTRGIFDGIYENHFLLESMFVKKFDKRAILVRNEFDKKEIEINKKKYNTVSLFKNSPRTPDKLKYDILFFPYLLDYSKVNEPDGKYQGDLFVLKNFLQKHLKVGGNALFLPNYYSYEGLCFPFVLKLFFKRVIIHKSEQLIALDYNGKSIDALGYPYFPKDIIKSYLPFAKNMAIHRIKMNKALVTSDKRDFFKIYQTTQVEIKQLLELPLTKVDTDYFLYTLKEFQKNPLDYKKYIKAGIGKEEGMFLLHTIVSHKLKKVLEVGFANGVSAAYMLVGLQETNGDLISIDPFQTFQWKDAGTKLVKDMKQSKRHTLIQKKSHVALPELLEKYGEESFDLIFIDGWHTFDYTLLDAFYAEKLVRKGGYIIIDDALHPGVNACVKYMDTNWKQLKHIKSAPRTFAAYLKEDDDKRDWHFHHVF